MNQNIIKAIIIDDEPEAIKYLEHQLAEFENILVVETIIDPRQALAKIIRNAPQLIFLDIQMPHLNGFDVITLIKNSHHNPCIIFTTAFDRFAIKAIKAGAFDYLLKPVDKDELRSAIENVQKFIHDFDLKHRIELLEQSIKSNHKIRFNTRSAYILIHPDEIFYIEADANYSEIHRTKSKREVVSINIGTVQELLPKQFFRISRSVIINVDYLVKVAGVTRKCFLNKEGEEIEFTVAETQLPELKRAIGE